VSGEGEDPTEINALTILGADPDIRKLASLERLRLAGKMAARVRNLTEAQKARRLNPGGKEITHGEFIATTLERENIVFGVEPIPVKEQARVMARQGMKIREIIEALGMQGIAAPAVSTLRLMVRDILAERKSLCVDCGVETRVSPLATAIAAIRCAECLRPLCPCGCGRRAPEGAMCPSVIAQRGGGPWVCASEAARRATRTRTQEQREASARKARAGITMTLEQKRASARKASAARWSSRPR